MADTAFCSAGKAGPVLSVDAARLRAIAAAVPVAEEETLPLDRAVGRVLSTPIAAVSALPPFDNSAMDGFALHLADLTGEGPWQLPVGGRIVAGDGRDYSLAPGIAARIFTGAPVPVGADAVVMQENVVRTGNTITVAQRPQPGQNIRRRGEDMAEGAQALAAGLVLTPPRLALLAGCGVPVIKVARRVRVAILSTGDELAEPGQALGPGEVFNSNRG